jgi:hypothetical protein
LKVSSPVGEFPFAVHRFGLRKGKLVMQGAMGAWPARVELSAGDLRVLAGVLRAPLAAIGLLVIAAGWLVLRK